MEKGVLCGPSMMEVVSRRVNGEQKLPGREILALIPGQELGMWSYSPQHHLLQLS